VVPPAERFERMAVDDEVSRHDGDHHTAHARAGFHRS
jgi:hypothetical protein